MKNVTIEGQAFQVKQAWSECTEDEILKLLPLQLVNPDDQEDPAGAGRLRRLALVVLMPGLDKFSKDLTDSQWWSLGRLTKWVWKTKVTTKPFPSFQLQHKGAAIDFLLPDDNFTNTTAIEIAMANIHYLSFTRPKNANHKAVFMLVATLCRPQRKDLATFQKSADWNGDKRMEYNTVLAEEWAAAFALLPLGTIMAITQYFEAMNDRFLTAYKAVYAPDPHAEEEEPLYHNGEGLVTTLMDIASAGVFGDFDKVCKQNGHTVWLYLKDNNLKIRRANKRAASQGK